MDALSFPVSIPQLLSVHGSATAPLLLDVRRRAAFDKATHLIAGAGWRDPDSVAEWARYLPRHRRIVYSGLDLQGRPVRREAEGFHARVVQHECDHLIGRLYPTRMRDLTQLGYTSVLFPELDAAADD